MKKLYLFLVINLFLLPSCGHSDSKPQLKSLRVKASAYNNLPGQTHRDHFAIGAWGDTLKEGQHIIAISRDLIDSGINHNTLVYIEGFEYPFLVRDKMNRRWVKKVDIFMGKDREKAFKFGVKELKISWTPENPKK